MVELRIGPPAAGGHCVAHHEAATVFVRGSLPDELVRARVEATGRGGRILFATVVEVVEASEFRVTPPCRYTDSCGGCDLQHVEVSHQREWKKQVLVDQLRTIGGVTLIGGQPVAEVVEVAEVGAGQAGGAAGNGLGWRS